MKLIYGPIAGVLWFPFPTIAASSGTHSYTDKPSVVIRQVRLIWIWWYVGVEW